MEPAARHWYQLHLGTKILLALMLAGAAHEVYEAAYDIFYGPAGDPCPELDILEIGFILTALAVATTVTEWLIRGRYLQLHLSTAFLLMLLASCCVWLNLRTSEPQRTEYGGLSVEGRGWPFGSRSVRCSDLKDAQKEFAAANQESPFGTWVVDAMICFVALFVVAFICEWRIRAENGEKRAG